MPTYDILNKRIFSDWEKILIDIIVYIQISLSMWLFNYLVILVYESIQVRLGMIQRGMMHDSENVNVTLKLTQINKYFIERGTYWDPDDRFKYLRSLYRLANNLRHRSFTILEAGDDIYEKFIANNDKLQRVIAETFGTESRVYEFFSNIDLLQSIYNKSFNSSISLSYDSCIKDAKDLFSHKEENFCIHSVGYI